MAPAQNKPNTPPASRDTRRMQQAIDEKLFRTMVNSIEDYAMVITDPDGFIVSWNKGAEITYRYRENEIIGLHIAFLYTPEAVANNEPARNLEEALKYSTYNTEGWRVRNKGEKFWADVHYTPLYDDDRHLLGYAKVTREVSNRKIAGAKDKKLKDKKQNLFTGNISFRKLIENSYEGITLLDKDLKIIYRSSSAERINGWDTADRLNEDIITLVHPDDKERIGNLLGGVLAEPAVPKTCTFRSKHFDGRYIWLESVYTNFLNDPDINAIICNFRDISEQKLNQDKIIESGRFTKTITDNLPALIAYWTADLRCLFANKPHLDWFDKSTKEMQGISKQELLGKEEFELHESHIRAVLEGQPQRFERTFYKSNGQHIFTDTQYLPDREGAVIKGFYSLIYDITPVKTAEIESKKALEERNTILESIDDAFFAVDKDWLVTYWNNMAENIFGKSRSQIVNRSLLKEYHYLVDTEAYKYYCQVIETGKSARFEYYTSHYNLWLDANVYPGTNGFTVYMKNITARKNAESSAMAALEERNTILESIDDAFFAVDKNWVVTYWNKMAEKVLQTPKDKILDHNLWEIFSDSVGSESYKKYHEAVETSLAAHFEDYYPSLNKWYEISAYPSETGLSVYFKDITDRKTSETRLKELNVSLQKHAKELAISNAELEQFAYVASHDLQEPLRMVTSFMSQLEKKYGDIIDDKGKQYIHFAVDGAKRMRQIILDLLEFSRVGRTEDDLEEVDLNKLIDGIVALYRKQIEEKHARIIVDNLPVVNIYKTPVRQVLQNLISNGLKYQQPGESPVINISCEETTFYWIISVKDNGIGIDRAYYDKIFIIFQRLHNKDEYAGTGMGLAITKKIIENMGGRVWVESAEGQGSTFYFTILKNKRL